jgi:hypothetical protein
MSERVLIFFSTASPRILLGSNSLGGGFVPPFTIF